MRSDFEALSISLHLSVKSPVLRTSVRILLASVAVPGVFGYFEVAADGADGGAGFQHAEDLHLVVMQNLLFGAAAGRAPEFSAFDLLLSADHFNGPSVNRHAICYCIPVDFFFLVFRMLFFRTDPHIAYNHSFFNKLRYFQRTIISTAGIKSSGTKIGISGLEILMICEMKTYKRHIRNLVLLPIAAVTCTMCVYLHTEYESYTNNKWTSDERPLGPMGVDQLVLSFERNGKVSVALDDDQVLEGVYKDDGSIATFSNLQVEIDGLDVTFIEAHLKSEETLFLLWQVEDILYPFTTALRPL